MNIPREHDRFTDFSQQDDLLGKPFSSNSNMSYVNSAYTSPYNQSPKKRKWVTGALAFLVPGTGHLYLGLMQRGLFIMMLIIIDIVMMVGLNTQEHTSTALMTFFALILPVIYFYNLFDALQSTDRTNRRNELGELAAQDDLDDPIYKLMRGSNLGVLLIAAGVLFFLLSSKPRWFEAIFDLFGSYIGSVVLILAGMVVFLLESRKNK
ncbi:DUF6677 family protein [Paenibacillus hexagrammi]|uniref:TM2 domain-containing protein n=1 Tax=Paenibacillus hexagrammi TaxID=2908839 RepID=A0ABY3SGY3_9BACL|nr:DUF6677 family protein [Paenibacillus sp. YPD9-1]UJF32446.1 hypothetical protein L0M14_22640 [Paenibacillus sp. YPD9-1]